VTLHVIVYNYVSGAQKERFVTSTSYQSAHARVFVEVGVSDVEDRPPHPVLFSKVPVRCRNRHPEYCVPSVERSPVLMEPTKTLIFSKFVCQFDWRGPTHYWICRGLTYFTGRVLKFVDKIGESFLSAGVAPSRYYYLLDFRAKLWGGYHIVFDVILTVHRR